MKIFRNFVANNLKLLFMAEEREWIVDNLIDNKNLIIPIIGNDMLVYKDEKTSEEIILQQHVVEYFADKDRIDSRKLSSMKNQEYYGMSVLSKECKYFIDNYRRYLKQEYSAGRISLKSSVLNFLKTFEFPVILTTNCFDFLEQELRKEGLSYPTLCYAPQKRNDKNGTEINANVDMPDKCVYHIFGLAEDAQDWVHSEDGLFFFLRSLNSKDNGAGGLANYIERNKKRILALGCNLPDWLFRLLWYPIQKKDNNNDEIKGYWLYEETLNSSFEDFLEDINYLSNEEVEEILVSTTKKLEKEKNDTREIVHEKNIKAEHFDVFLSYASEDRQLVDVIYEILHGKHRLSVWFDDRGEGEISIGDPYWNNIKEGICKSDHYMPIITESWMEKNLGNSNLKRETDLVKDYYLQKTNNGENKENLKTNYSLPIVVKGEQFRGKAIFETDLIQDLSKNNILPKDLFFEIKSGEFDINNIKLFDNKDWTNIM